MNGNGGVWKWIAGSLAALIVGVLLGLVPGCVSNEQTQAQVEQLESEVESLKVQLARVEERLVEVRARLEDILRALEP